MRVALVTFNAQDHDAIGNQVAEKLAFFIERCADAALVHSRCSARELTDGCRFAAGRVCEIGLPVDTGRFSLGAAGTDPRAALGSANVTVLLYVGRVAPSKRLSALVEAVALLR